MLLTLEPHGKMLLTLVCVGGGGCSKYTMWFKNNEHFHQLTMTGWADAQ